jgi:LEA14-like dessication related protein
MRCLGAVLALALLGACSTMKLEKPHLDVVDVQLLRSDLLSQQLRVRMRVDNPNDRELPVKAITYQLLLAGEEIANGESEKNFTVPALGSTEFDVSMKANAANALLRLLGGGRKLDSLDYRLVGKVSLSSGMLRTIPFDETGQIKLR